MISEDFRALIRGNFVHIPTQEQDFVIDSWCKFLLGRSDDSMFLLKGYAGTGKTSLVGALVRTMKMLKQRVVLLAPTGRAAKVMGGYADTSAGTIHRHIYRQKTFGEERFTAAPNLKENTLYIVDEASMIANEGLSGSVFGDGRLLDDLIHFVYSSPGCRLILIGDTAQLPPVGEEHSPALDRMELGGYGLEVIEAELTQVVRQLDSSGILWNATRLRECLTGGCAVPKIRVSFPDVHTVPGNELIEYMEQSYHRCGKDGTIVITRSNKRANIYNMGIRNRILDYDCELGGGDMVMVAKNKYLNGKDLIANGEMAIVQRLRNERELYGFRFADATLKLIDRTDSGQEEQDGQGIPTELDTVVLLDTLHSEAPALTREQQQQLFMRVCEDYPELRNKRDLFKAVKEDKHYGALQIKYAYAITCHKAQGGQWEDVYIDQGYMTEDMLTEDYIRWLYTAITRATGHVYLVNWPEEQTENA
ncbi:MAG: AAA family ATPase [Bacteroidaceae bacterium]|nr:AAA family ATPase [Bacteroidaceae bacterium]